MPFFTVLYYEAYTLYETETVLKLGINQCLAKRGICPERSEVLVLSEARASEWNYSLSCADNNRRVEGTASEKFRLNMHSNSVAAHTFSINFLSKAKRNR